MDYTNTYYKVFNITELNNKNHIHDYMKGRICKIVGFLSKGYPCYLDFMGDSENGSGGLIRTSSVVDYTDCGNGDITIKTKNTIYELTTNIYGGI